MKLKVFALSLFVFAAVSAANGQTTDEPQKHSFSFGPTVGFHLGKVAGYNHDAKGVAYGVGLMYEYRPFQKLGFTAGLSYDRMKTDVSDTHYGDIGGSPVYGDSWIHQVYSLNVGARYYMGGFYLGGALGVGLDNGHTTLSDGTTVDGGKAYGLYKSLAAGYQIPLKNRDAIEIEAGVFGTKGMKVGGTVRYKFGR